MVNKFRALVGLNYPTDPRILARLAAGEWIPYHERGERRVEPGEIVDDIPADSTSWLLEQHLIEPITERLVFDPVEEDENSG